MYVLEPLNLSSLMFHQPFSKIIYQFKFVSVHIEDGTHCLFMPSFKYKISGVLFFKTYYLIKWQSAFIKYFLLNLCWIFRLKESYS